MSQRIGIYSGTFDPVHQGHIAFAEEALKRCGLSKVVFLPERNPRSKQNVTDISHRLNLLETAAGSVSGLEVLDLTTERLTVENTLPKLQVLYGDCQLVYLMGSDIVCSLDKWEDIKKLLQGVSFVIGMRGDETQEKVNRTMKALQREHGVTVQYTCINTLQGGLASSQIRNGSASNLALHPEVLTYIQEEGLYKV